MRYRQRHRLFRPKRRIFPCQHHRFPIRHQPPVFHCPRFKIRQRHLVQLFQRIFHPKIIIIKLQRLRRHLVRKIHRLQLLRQRTIRRNLRSMRILHRLSLKFPDHKRKQICRHPWRRLKSSGIALLFRLVKNGRRIRQNQIRLIKRRDRELKHRLRRRLINTRKRLSRIMALELRGHNRLCSPLILIRRQIRSLHVFIQTALIPYFDPNFAPRHLKNA